MYPVIELSIEKGKKALQRKGSRIYDLLNVASEDLQT